MEDIVKDWGCLFDVVVVLYYVGWFKFGEGECVNKFF